MASVSGGLFGAGLASAGGAGTRIGAAFVEVFANTAPLQAGLAGAEARFGKFGAGLQRASIAASRTGAFMTRNLTVPLIAAGGVAVKMAADFEFAMARTSNLAGIAEEDLAGFRTEVMRLSHETAQAPAELADALYIVASAGLKASQVLPVLEYSARAAAAGMTTTTTAGHLLSGVMVAYGDQAPTAAQAMDVLTAAVREGKAEPQELAQNLGTVVPVAAVLGVGFDELAGYVAALTNENVNAARAATGLRYLLIQLQNPSDQAKEKIESVGLSMQQLQDVAGEQGLATALQLLADRFDLTSAKGRESFYEVVGGVRAGHIAIGLIGEAAHNVNRIVGVTAKAMSDAGNEFDTAFGKQTQTDLFKFQQAWNDLRIAAIEAGAVLMPIAQNLVSSIADLATSFNNLSDAQQSNIIKWGLIVAAAGPVIRIFGTVTGVIVKLIGWYRALAAAAAAAAAAQVASSTVASTTTTAAAAVPAFTYGRASGFPSYAQIAEMKAAQNAANGAAAAQTTAAASSSAWLSRLGPLAAGLGRVSGIAAAVTLGVAGIDNVMSMLSFSTGKLSDDTGIQVNALNSMADAVRGTGAELNMFRTIGEATTEMSDRFNTVLGEAVESGMDETQALELLYGALGRANDQVGGLTGSFDKFEGVLREAVGVGVSPQLENLRAGFQAFREDVEAARASLSGVQTSMANIGPPAVEAPQLDVDFLEQAFADTHLIDQPIVGAVEVYDTAIRNLAESVNTYLSEGGKMKTLIGEITQWARAGTLEWELYNSMLGDLGVQAPFQELGRFGVAINQAADATQNQRTQLAGALRTINAYGVGVNNARAASALAAAENGDLAGSYQILSNAISREVLGKLKEVKGELSKAQVLKIKTELLHADPMEAIAMLNRALRGAKLDPMKVKAEVDQSSIESIRQQNFDFQKGQAAAVEITAELKAGNVNNAIKALTNPEQVTITAKAKVEKADGDLDAVANETRTASIDAKIGSNAWTTYSPPDKTAYVNVITREVDHSGGLVGSGRISGSSGREVDVRALAGEYITNVGATRRSRQLLNAINQGRIDDRTLVGAASGGGSGGGRRGVGISTGNVVNVNLHVDGFKGDASDLARKVGLELSRVAGRHMGGYSLSG